VARAIDAELTGTRGSVEGFSEDLGRVHAAYQRNRLRIYAEEQRWAERDFWRRRHGGSPASPGTPAR